MAGVQNTKQCALLEEYCIIIYNNFVCFTGVVLYKNHMCLILHLSTSTLFPTAYLIYVFADQFALLLLELPHSVVLLLFSQ